MYDHTSAMEPRDARRPGRPGPVVASGPVRLDDGVAFAVVVTPGDAGTAPPRPLRSRRRPDRSARPVGDLLAGFVPAIDADDPAAIDARGFVLRTANDGDTQVRAHIRDDCGPLLTSAGALPLLLVVAAHADRVEYFASTVPGVADAPAEVSLRPLAVGDARHGAWFAAVYEPLARISGAQSAASVERFAVGALADTDLPPLCVQLGSEPLTDAWTPITGAFAASPRGLGPVELPAVVRYEPSEPIGLVAVDAVADASDATLDLAYGNASGRLQCRWSCAGLEVRVGPADDSVRVRWSTTVPLPMGRSARLQLRFDGTSAAVLVDDELVHAGVPFVLAPVGGLELRALTPGVRIERLLAYASMLPMLSALRSVTTESGRVSRVAGAGVSRVADAGVSRAAARRAVMPDVTVEIRARIGRDGRTWDALVDQAAFPVPFLRSWWLDALTVAEPCIVCCVRDGQLLGGIALERDVVLGVERYRVLGRELTPDHFDLVAVPSERLVVVDALREWWRRPGARIIDLEGVADPSFVRASLPAPVHVGVDNIVRFSQASGVEMVRRIEQRLLRANRRLAREGVTFRRVPDEEIGRAIDDLMVLHQLRWAGRSLLVPHRVAFRAVAEAGAGTGEFRVYEARVDDRTVGVEVLGLVAGRACTIQGGRDPAYRFRGVGQALMGFAVRDAVEHGGADVLDLLRGEDTWKEEWSQAVGRILRLRATAGVRGRAAERGDALRSWVTSLV